MFLGIDDNSGLVYESSGSNPDRPVLPTPTVSRAQIIESPADWKSLGASVRSDPIAWLFREDSFDAVTRTRRGRLYQPMSGAPYPNHSARVLPLPFEQLARSDIGPDGRLHRPLGVYAAGTSLLERDNGGLRATLALGNNRAASAWRIVDVEITVSDDVMLTLRSLSSLGVMPQLQDALVAERFRADVVRAWNRVVDSAFKESPAAVVDQCRDAAALIASRWIAQQSGEQDILRKDLAKVGEALGAEPWKKFVAANCAKTIALLHSRGKSNEQFAKGVSAPGEVEAEFSIHALALLLRELGWARDVVA